jgi:feruloyl esterase
VEGVIQPSSDSHIEFEVWLPSSGWNGKYLGVGNGGLGGSINYTARADSNAPDLAQAIASGYATSSTDTGHKGVNTDADWALGHLEKIIDYGYRAIHETAIASKAIVKAFYDGDPRESYFNSCSNGGRQALMEAQRYPADYNGIVAGDPAYFSTHQSADQIWNAQALMANPASYIPSSKLPAIEAAVLATCDALDGVKDGLITEPTKCHFDPAILLCKGEDSNTCLTQPQVQALKKIYAGPRTSKGEQIFPGMLPGDEAGPRGWNYWITGSEPGKSAQYVFGVVATAKMAYQNPAWDFRAFNFDHDVAFLDEKVGPIRNATNPDLMRFKGRGGKLILYHGWSDSAIAPLSTVNYYESVVSKMGQKDVDDFVRLYMVPGMQHCGGGPGPNVFDSLSGSFADPQHSVQLALERWTEKGAAPDQIIARQYKNGGNSSDGAMRTRPLCRYPQVARYTGSGSTDDAANFTCKMP